ncbi:MAG: flagellar basal-body rod protein FlgC [Gammaproteobacteria bacterium SG8_47]|nr:MAG: flagellar basal-body rod protein FlgC [Gammaproteobacteria bacterium SG8_47]
MSLFNVLDVGGSAMQAQSLRLNVTASNLANAESISSSTGQTYRARHPVFAPLVDEFGDAQRGAGVRVLGVVESSVAPRQEYRPDHPLADADGFIYMPNINVVEEMANMISASRSYQAAVEMMSTSKQMLLGTLRLGE